MLNSPVKFSFATIALVVVLASVLPMAASRGGYPGEQIPPPLEVRIASTPRWENGCLAVHVDRTNRSSVPIFLSEMGPYLDMALDVSTPKASAVGREYAWINLRGVSDIISLHAAPLAPDVTVHNDFCLGPLVWIANFKKETHREIPVRGQLRIRVSYFLSEDASKQYRDWFDDSHRPELPSDIAPKWATVFAEIPCSEATCASGCAKPPLGITGEVRPVPDVAFLTPDWDDRGRALTAELAHKFPPCVAGK